MTTVNKEEFLNFINTESKKRRVYRLETVPYDPYNTGRLKKIFYIDKDKYFNTGEMETIAWTFEYEPKGISKECCIGEKNREYYILKENLYGRQL